MWENVSVDLIDTWVFDVLTSFLRSLWTMGNCCLFMVLILSQTIPDWSTREILLSYCKNSITYNRNEVKIRNQERFIVTSEFRPGQNGLLLKMDTQNWSLPFSGHLLWLSTRQRPQQERIIGKERKTPSLALGMCEFHQSYF